MTYQRRTSGNPNGRPKGKPTGLTGRVRELVERDGATIVKEIIKNAKDGEVEAGAKYLLPASADGA